MVLACRSGERGERAASEIRAGVPDAALEVMEVDVSEQAPLERFVAELQRRHGRLDVLVNNAVISTPDRRLTSDGIELCWATNVLGYYSLMTLLEPTLRASAPARVINVVSAAAAGLDLADVEFRTRPYRWPTVYAQSKLSERLLTWAFAARLRGSGVTANAIHPGGVRSDLSRHLPPGIVKSLIRFVYLFAPAPERASKAVSRLAFAPELTELTAAYFEKHRQRQCKFAAAPEVEQVWRLCGEMVQRRRSSA